MLVEQKGAMRQATVSSLGTEGDSSALEVQIRLVGGIGVSVINSVPEELVFINLEQIQVDYLRTSKLETLEGSIGRIQVSAYRVVCCKRSVTVLYIQVIQTSLTTSGC